MSNSNKHIEEFLDYYLNKEQSPDYAVLITGCWGSGKTYFIRQYLEGKGAAGKDVVKETDWLTGFEKYTVVYVSLFGIKMREDINKKIERILHPKINSKNLKYLPDAISLVSDLAGIAVGTAVTATMTLTTSGSAASFAVPAGVAAKKASGSFFKNILTKIFNRKKDVEYFSSNFLEEIKKKRLVVIFDDVERADMPLPELLGYLNEYVEHLHIPCILLADKEKWEEAQKCQEDKSTLHHLSSTKEKVIGKEFQIQTDCENVVNAWLSPEYGCLDVSDNVRKLWWENRESIYDLFACFDNAKQKYLGEGEFQIITSKQSEYDWKQMKEYVSKIPNRNFRALKQTIKNFDNLCSYYCKELGNLLNTQKSIEHGVRKVFVRHFLKMRYGLTIGMYDASKTNRSSILKYVNDEKAVENSLTKYDCFENVLYDADSLDGFPMQEWLSNGCFDRRKAIEDISTSAWFGGYDDYMVRRFYHWWSLSDEEAAESYGILRNCLKNGNISAPNTLIYVFVVLSILSEDEKSSFSKDDIAKMMNEYIDKYREKIDPEKVDDLSTIEMSYSCIDKYQKLLIPFRKRLVDLVMGKSKIQKESQERNFICDLQKGNSEQFCNALTLISNVSNNMFFRWTDIDVIKFVDVFRKLSRSCRDDVIQSVHQRYLNIIYKNVNDLQTEKIFLNSLKKECEKQTQEKEEVPLPSIFSLRKLIKVIDDSLTKIKKREKENAT